MPPNDFVLSASARRSKPSCAWSGRCIENRVGGTGILPVNDGAVCGQFTLKAGKTGRGGAGEKVTRRDVRERGDGQQRGTGFGQPAGGGSGGGGPRGGGMERG